MGNDALVLWEIEPAGRLAESHLLGNGRLGAAIFGSLPDERIAINGDTLWSGSESFFANPDAVKLLPEANRLVTERMLGGWGQAYEPLGTLHISVGLEPEPGKEFLRRQRRAAPAEYRRSLDLESAVASVEYREGGRRFLGECFASAPDQVVAVRLSVDSGVMHLAAHTSYAGYGKARSPEVARLAALCAETLDRAAASPWDELRERHTADHRALFGRVAISIGPATTAALPTSKRLSLQAGTVADPSFAALALQYTRYLLIASSRPGTQAAYLQGIWNDLVRPPWSSNYTTNINVEMNYWRAEVLGLPECHEPLYDFVTETADSGRRTAWEWYGLDGWVAHHNVDLWRNTTPSAGLPSWSWWPMAAGWLCQHLWRHVEYTGDMEFLEKRAYPVIEDAARFLLGILVEDEEGYLSTAPSTSPENSFFVDEWAAQEAALLEAMSPDNRMAVHNRTSAVCKSSTMDLTIIREVFTHCLRGAAMLECRGELHERMERALERLYPFKVGRHGQLQEWCFDFDECMPGMGHVSHTYGLYPGNLFTPRRNPELYEACRKGVFRRHAHGAFTWGWPAAWAVALFARLREPEAAGLMVKGSCRGLGAGIAEMLLQSHDGRIELLPALPGSWTEGRVTGLRAVGGFEVSFLWEQGLLIGGEVRSTLGEPCRVEGPGIVLQGFHTEPGETCSIAVG